MGEMIDFKTPDDWNARVFIYDDGRISYEETRVINPEYGTLGFGDAGNVDPQNGVIDLTRGSRRRRSILDTLREKDPKYWGSL